MTFSRPSRISFARVFLNPELKPRHCHRALKLGDHQWAGIDAFGGLSGRRSISGMQQRCRSVAFQRVPALIFLGLIPVDKQGSGT
jgi:hypothetical protein